MAAELQRKDLALWLCEDDFPHTVEASVLFSRLHMDCASFISRIYNGLPSPTMSISFNGAGPVLPEHDIISNVHLCKT